MTATLQDAMTAVRGGEIERAQLLTAEVIRDNPNDPNAWYLLSQLVDSDARRAAYLGKAVALDPGHERARAELAAMPTAVTASLDVPLPAEPTAEPSPVAIAADAVAVEAAATSGPASDDVPEWLRPLSPEPTPVAVTAPAVSTTTVTTTAVAEPAVVPPAPAPARPRPKTPPPPPPRRRGNGALTILLVLLGLLTLAVLAVLAFLLLS
jgi:hypothetical protein